MKRSMCRCRQILCAFAMCFTLVGLVCNAPALGQSKKGTSKATSKSASGTSKSSKSKKAAKARAARAARAARERAARERAVRARLAIPCVRPDTGASWFRAQRAWQALDSIHDWTNDALRNDLLNAARRVSLATASQGNVEIGASIFVASPPRLSSGDVTVVEPMRASLREMAQQGGWPLRSAVGAAGVHAAWILATSDTVLAQLALLRMRDAKRGEVSPADVAVLDDMVHVARGEKQRYATQLVMKRDEFGIMHVDPAPTENITRVAKVDSLRTAARLPKLADALCVMRAMVPGAGHAVAPGGN